MHAGGARRRLRAPFRAHQGKAGGGFAGELPRPRCAGGGIAGDKVRVVRQARAAAGPRRARRRRRHRHVKTPGLPLKHFKHAE